MKALANFWKAALELSPTRLALFLFGLAFLIRLVVIIIFHPYRGAEPLELERVAISLAKTGVYGNPYAVPTGPTAHVSPGYTLILAGIFKLFGTGTSGQIVKEILAAAVTALSCALLPAVAEALSLGRAAGTLAGLIFAVYPDRPLVQIDGNWEAPYIVLSLMFAAVSTVRLWREKPLSPKTAFSYGLCWGIALLFVSSLLSVFLVLLGAGLYSCRTEVRRYLAFAAVEALVAILCLVPWAIRNERAVGAPILTRSNLGLELYVSNNDDAEPDQRVNYLKGVFGKYHPLLSVPEATKVRQMGEVAYNKQASAKAKEWIRAHFKRFIELCLGRARCFWFYIDPTSPLKTAFINVTVLLGLVGLIYVWCAEPITGAALGLILLIFPVPNYLVHVSLRQEYPIQWLMDLLSAVLILRWVARLQIRQSVPTPEPSRVPVSLRASLRDNPVPY